MGTFINIYPHLNPTGCNANAREKRICSCKSFIYASLSLSPRSRICICNSRRRFSRLPDFFQPLLRLLPFSLFFFLLLPPSLAFSSHLLQRNSNRVYTHMCTSPLSSIFLRLPCVRDFLALAWLYTPLYCVYMCYSCRIAPCAHLLLVYSTRDCLIFFRPLAYIKTTFHSDVYTFCASYTFPGLQLFSLVSKKKKYPRLEKL